MATCFNCLCLLVFPLSWLRGRQQNVSSVRHERVKQVLSPGGLYLQMLQFVHGVAAQLADTGVPGTAEMGLQLFLTAADSASEVARLELITYEFFEQV